MLVINPDECIDCALCEPECPADAIYTADELPDAQSDFLSLNQTLCSTWPNIVDVKLPPEDADYWKGKPNKRAMLVKKW